MYTTKDKIIDVLAVIVVYGIAFTLILATIAASLYLFKYIIHFHGL